MRLLIVVSLCASLCPARGPVAWAAAGRSRAQPRRESRRPPFRYVIISNRVDVPAGDPGDAVREMTILLDEKAFSEKTLRELFRLVLRRYPEPARLTATVYTSLEQLGTPEEAEQGVLSEVGDTNPASDHYHRAVLIRTKDGGKLIRYSTSLPVLGLKTIALEDANSRRP